MRHVKTGGLEKNVRLLAWFNLFLGLQFHVIIAPVYFAAVTGSITKAAIVLATVYVAAAVLEVPTGVVSDRIGRRYSAVLGAAASVVAVCLYAIGFSFWILMLGAVFEGLRRALISGNNEALLFESLKSGPSNAYAHNLGRTQSLLEISLALAGPVASIVAAWDLHAAVALGIIPQLACVMVALRLVEPPHGREHVGNAFSHVSAAVRAIRSNKRLRLLTFANSVNYGLGEATYLFRPAFFASLWPLWALGFAQLLANFGTASSSWFAGPIMKRFGTIRSVFGASVMQRVFAIGSTAFPTVLSPLVYSMNSFGYGPRNVGERTLLQQEFTDEQRATIGSLVSLLGSVVLAGGLVTLGVIADATSAGTALLIAHIALVLPIGAYVLLVRSSHRAGHALT
jgi:MFS family permease